MRTDCIYVKFEAVYLEVSDLNLRLGWRSVITFVLNIVKIGELIPSLKEGDTSTAC
jgi:hypothetical protein